MDNQDRKKIYAKKIETVGYNSKNDTTKQSATICYKCNKVVR